MKANGKMIPNNLNHALDNEAKLLGCLQNG